MQRFFALDMPFLRFARNTMLLSLAGLTPLLVLFVTLTPGFASALSESGQALGRFLRQVITNGLPIVFVMNFLAFFLYASTEARGDLERRPGLTLFLDISARIISFIALHILIYVLSADWFGSFGGSRATAVRVVAPTLARSAFFENISGVYLYATLVSAIPLYVTVIQRWLTEAGLAAHRPVRGIAVALSLMLFGGVVALLTGIAYLVTELQPTR
ncbi:hypothetical protein [Tranquillimonas alkanivorans]|uniref:Uncharacterized protein n=1 Tax=Tranquillimonas alkanivorans TaxID=441119 RepID=A0A1I5V5H6_9RHOB|nr:hypothetical protein [Tranquillimonas alkanivorans]SFQ02186.1 hypothetical protein SAMN04488047_1274 [Tranquillimonas alkanivorans]